MTALLVLNPNLIEQFHVRALAEGWVVETFDSLADIVSVTNREPSDIHLPDWPEIITAESGETIVRGAAQPLTITGDWHGANWGLARHTSRNLPWTTKGLRFPVSASFECHRTGEGVDIYVIDTGVDTTHPDLVGRSSHLWSSNSVTTDDHGHGTGCASVAAGSTVGFARSAYVYGVKVLGSDNMGSMTDIINGISQSLTHYNSRSATNRPAVASISIVSASSVASAAISNMLDAGIVVVTCAGNDRSNLDTGYNSYPAEDAGVITVGAITPADTPSQFSNYGSRVDILAAGSWVYCATIASKSASRYAVWSGTSFSCPAVAGAVACMLQDYQRLTSRTQTQCIKAYLRDQATYGRYLIDESKVPNSPAILYLDPTETYPAVDGLIVKVATEEPEEPEEPIYDLSFQDDILAWWDPSVGITEASGALSLWEDRINGTAMAPLASSSPVYEPSGLNGLPVINCLSLARLEAELPITGTSSMTVCGVFKHVAQGNNYYGRVFSFSTKLYATEDQYHSRHFTFCRYAGSSNISTYRATGYRGAVASSYDTWHVVIIRWGPSLSMFLDNNPPVTSTYSAEFNIAQAGIFNEVGGDEHGRGKVADFMVIPRALTDTEVGEVRAYLQEKYAL